MGPAVAAFVAALVIIGHGMSRMKETKVMADLSVAHDWQFTVIRGASRAIHCLR